MEKEWKEGLKANHGVTFDALIALNNMPISRFLEWLESSGNLQGYMETLVNAYNPATVAGLMCRNTLSVSWDGRLYDCDFNQMLEMPILDAAGNRLHIASLALDQVRERSIQVGDHCYACTAGSGSSCGGELVQ
jgi:radical SAM/Cys-rich protein